MDSKTLNQKFESRRAGVDCPMCPDAATEDLVLELPSGKLHLQNDADYRGYCILICRRHAVELHDLTEEERKNWIEDIAAVGKALMEICGPAKLNITMLGNMVPHLHCHLMPRYPENEDWGHPPSYRRPAERRELSIETYQSLLMKLRAALQRPS